MKKGFDFKKLLNDKRFIAGCIGALAAVIFACFVFSAPGDKEIPSSSLSARSESLPEYAPFVSRQVKEAYDKNPDTVGWLKIPGCEIDNPVFQGKDNDRYLRVSEEGEYDVWGCYFLDYINKNDGNSLTDRVNIIYGHSLDDYPDSEKFSKLKRYKDREFALENSRIEFDLLYRGARWEIFSVCDIPVTIDYIDPNPGADKWRRTLKYIKGHSYVDFDTEAGEDDRILILSTCTSDENVRFIVAAKLSEEGFAPAPGSVGAPETAGD